MTNTTWSFPVKPAKEEWRVLICGDRDWDDENAIAMVVEGLYRRAQRNRRKLVIIHGAARGADSIAGEIASRFDGVEVKEYPAQWKKHGKKAGPLRNIRMLQEGQPQLVIAFHDNLASSKGTLHMTTISSKAGLDVYVISRYAPV